MLRRTVLIIPVNNVINSSKNFSVVLIIYYLTLISSIQSTINDCSSKRRKASIERTKWSFEITICCVGWNYDNRRLKLRLSSDEATTIVGWSYDYRRMKLRLSSDEATTIVVSNYNVSSLETMLAMQLKIRPTHIINQL